MASNVLTNVIPRLLAQGLVTLRENAVMPRLVANMSSAFAGRKGSTIDVPIPSAIVATEVTPAATAPAAGAVSPGTVPVVLDKWWEAAFDLSDNEYEQVMDGVIPMQAAEAVKAIVNKVDQSIMALYTGIYGFFGTAGTTPFGTPGILDGVGIRKVLENQLAPKEPRHVVMNPDAEAAALALTQFANMEFSGSVDAMREGMLNRKLGMQWWMNQNIPTHVSPAATAGAITVNGVNALGATTISIAKASNATNLIVGDILTIAHAAPIGTRSYVVTANVTLGVGNTNVGIYPALPVATAGGEAVTKINTHVANLALHRDAIAFASRPLIPVAEGLGAISLSQVDPISGLPLRIEVTREFKRTRWSFDLLWGVKLVMPQLAARLLG